MSSIIKVGKVQSSTGQDAVTVADSGAITANGALTASGGIANAGTISAGTIGSNVTIADGASPHGWEHIKTIAYTADTSTDLSANGGVTKMDNVISDKYTAYKLIVQWSSATTGSDVYFRWLDSSGTALSSANYNYSYQAVNSNGSEEIIMSGASATESQIGNDILSGALGWNGEITFWNCFSGQSNFPQVDGHQLTHDSRNWTYYPTAWFKQTGYDNPNFFQGGTGHVSFNGSAYVRGFYMWFASSANVEKDSWWSFYGLKLPTSD